MTRHQAIPKVFILTLEAHDRSEALQSMLRAQNVEYQVVFGIDGRNGLPAEYEAQIDREKTKTVFGREMSDGEYACALSHQLIYQKIIEQGLKRAVVFEDDALPLSAFFALERDYFEAKDLTLLYHYNTYVRRSAPNAHAHPEILPLNNSPFMACAYIIAAPTAQLILEHARPIVSPADWPIELGDINAGAAWPYMAEHIGQKTSNLSDKRPKSLRKSIDKNYVRTKTRKLLGKKIA